MIADDVKGSCYKCIKFLLTENYNGMFLQLRLVPNNKKTTQDGVAFSIYHFTT